MKTTDNRDADEEHAETEAQPALGDLFLIVVAAPLHDHRGNRRERSDRHQDLAPTEQPGRAGIDTPADRPDDVGEDREQAQDAEDSESDRERVDAVIGQLFGEFVPPSGPGLDASFRSLPSRGADFD